MRLHHIVTTNEAAQILLPLFQAIKKLFLMPHFRQGMDNPEIFSICKPR